MQPVIGVRSLLKSHDFTIAVDDLTFEVTPGTVSGFLGPNTQASRRPEATRVSTPIELTGAADGPVDMHVIAPCAGGPR